MCNQNFKNAKHNKMYLNTTKSLEIKGIKKKKTVHGD